MSYRIRSSIAAFAALVAVACAPDRVLAAPVVTVEQAAFCQAAAQTSRAIAADLIEHDEAAMPAIEQWWDSLTDGERANLLPYVMAGFAAADRGFDPQALGQQAFDYCMSQRGA